MGNFLKKAVVLTLAGTLALGSMTGCSKSLDGTKAVSTVNDEEIKLGTVNLMLRYQQAQTAQMYEMYFGATSGIWDTVADEETGETYGDQTVANVMEQLEDMVILRQHAEEYGVTISEEEQKKITEAAKSFMESNDEATIATLGVDQSMVEEVLALSYYKEFMYDPLTVDVNTEVSDEEAAQTGVTFVKVADSSDEDASEDGEEDKDKKEEKKEEKVSAKEKAQQILDEVLATADADMDSIAKEVDENLSATTTHFTTNPKEDEDSTAVVPQEVQDAVKKLTDGEVAGELVVSDDTYYVVRLDAAMDQESTEYEKTTIVNDRKQEAYNEITEQWREDSKISQDEKALKTLKVKDNEKYSFKQSEDASADEEAETTDSAE